MRALGERLFCISPMPTSKAKHNTSLQLQVFSRALDALLSPHVVCKSQSLMKLLRKSMQTWCGLGTSSGLWSSKMNGTPRTHLKRTSTLTGTGESLCQMTHQPSKHHTQQSSTFAMTGSSRFSITLHELNAIVVNTCIDSDLPSRGSMLKE